MAKAAAKTTEPTVGGVAVDRLRSLVERIERLEEERKAIGSDIKDIFAEAKSAGFDVKVLRSVIRVRKLEPSEYEEADLLLATYLQALGVNSGARERLAKKDDAGLGDL